MIHENSIEAHKEHQGSGKGQTYRERIVELLTNTTRPMTDREIQYELGVAEKSNIQPEITRLKQKGRVAEVGKITCPSTGKKVRLVAMA